MSGHNQGTPARVLKSSPNLMKQGPMKATIPMSSLLKQTSNLRKSISPTLSPTNLWKTRTSPDHSCGQRSPGSSINKVKSRTLGCNNGSGNAIRRTASLDAIYLKGQWPRDRIFCMQSILQIDKATQTEDTDWVDSRKVQLDNADKLEKIIVRQRLQRSTQSPIIRPPSSPGNVIGDHTLTASSQTNTSCIMPRATPVNIPIKPLPKPTMRSSVEGLNQEIERLVKSAINAANFSDRCEDYDKFAQITPEGHRAPLPDLFRTTTTRSVNTQTPSASDVTGSCQSSSPPSRDSLSPMIQGHLDTSPSETGGSQGSSPDQEGNRLGSSPQIFVARGPPDGCERVHLKSVDDRRSLNLDHTPQLPCTFQLKPSQGSAFKMLQPSSFHPSKQTLPLVPSPKDLI